MGKEAEAVCHWRGQSASAKVLLEAAGLILRSPFRTTISRSAISLVAVRGASLVVKADGEDLVVDLGERDAGKWAAAILKPPPSLAAKLGIGRAGKALVIGAVADEALAEALIDLTTDDPAKAVVLVAELETLDALTGALDRAKASNLPIWCVYPKGGRGPIGEGEVRAQMRGAGFMDNKTCAVSTRMTATRYAPRARQP